ncbi:NADPH-dependent ferric siderophore reductase, contains FAD-binding and SIP domains [Jatrophihabitans endophyticus]|uniref:NADPH-dependent ferric siderophore reductase, contains FAD-binding and SIP domains n=1 Tax=Jatrophihabitans endophyticus TaxID=1206085 RepID=A0A1M5KAI4_9ACTN|nr:siderophore-interacting protein [Jatrophihabitans endophyticus]SHG49856.1 NADPH-dependent ferric siderophore reductase, contains FAD-binding and SIP domains [Jatrophihabitans endophyticus]
MSDRRPTPKTVTVLRTQRLSESLVRLVVGGDSLADFDPIHADSYVKVCFDGGTENADGAGRPRMRTYTVRTFDPAARELTLDFVVHGDSGLAGPWAAAAQVGDEVRLLGPGGGYSPSAEADWHLLAGDESALPAIAAALERLPEGAVAHAFVEVHGPGDEIELATGAGTTVSWLHRGTGAVGSRLVEAVTEWEPPAGEGQWFVHGEAGVVKALRRYLRLELGVPMSQLSISGYWRLGVDDEGWRAVKREWNQELEDAERAVAS